jgi:hypothetical protein
MQYLFAIAYSTTGEKKKEMIHICMINLSSLDKFIC